MNAEFRAREQRRDAEIVRLRSELQQHPDDAEGWANLGKALGIADSASAIEAFNHATRLAPNVAAHWQSLGEARGSPGNEDPTATEQAQVAFQNCLQRDPVRGDCHFGLGVLQHSQGDHAAALESFTRAAQHGADCESKYGTVCEYVIAKEMLDLGKLERAGALVRESLARMAVQPGNADQLYFLQSIELRIRVQQGNLEQAEAARQKLAEYARGLSPDIAFNLGSTDAVAQPPRLGEARQLLGSFIQSSCEAPEATGDCPQCGVARDLLDHLARTSP